MASFLVGALLQLGLSAGAQYGIQAVGDRRRRRALLQATAAAQQGHSNTDARGYGPELPPNMQQSLLDPQQAQLIAELSTGDVEVAQEVFQSFLRANQIREESRLNRNYQYANLAARQDEDRARQERFDRQFTIAQAAEDRAQTEFEAEQEASAYAAANAEALRQRELLTLAQEAAARGQRTIPQELGAPTAPLRGTTEFRKQLEPLQASARAVESLTELVEDVRRFGPESNPDSPRAQRQQQAYQDLLTAVRVMANLGTPQAAELRLLANTYRDPNAFVQNLISGPAPVLASLSNALETQTQVYGDQWLNAQRNGLASQFEVEEIDRFEQAAIGGAATAALGNRAADENARSSAWAPLSGNARVAQDVFEAIGGAISGLLN